MPYERECVGNVCNCCLAFEDCSSLASVAVDQNQQLNVLEMRVGEWKLQLTVAALMIKHMNDCAKVTCFTVWRTQARASRPLPPHSRGFQPAL